MLQNYKGYMLTIILVGANIAAYVLTSVIGGNFVETDSSIIVNYGLYTRAVLNGEVWRLLTSLFVHANVAHIAGNMLFLSIYGLRAEEMFDAKEYVAIYLLSGLAGNALTMLADLATFGTSYSVGASGAIFGILGAVMIYMRRSIGQSILSALVFVFFLFAINIGPGVNILAHLGGLVTGLVIGYALAATRKRRQYITYQYNYPSSYSR